MGGGEGEGSRSSRSGGSAGGNSEESMVEAHGDIHHLHSLSPLHGRQSGDQGWLSDGVEVPQA